MAAYPLAIGFTTAVKNGRMVVRPLPLAGSATPSGAPPPPSPTNPGGHSLAMTCFSFTVVLMAHLILVAHILMKRPVGASEMRKSYAAAAPLLMTFFTIGYYINYLGLTRNDAFVIEWIIFSVFSAATIFMSCFVYVVRVCILLSSAIYIHLFFQYLFL
jgi:hypothetical protein